MELSDSVDTMVFDLLEVPIVDKDITGIAENTTIDGNVFNDYLWLKKQYVQKWSIMCQDEYDRLRGFWTRQFGNAEVPFYRLFYGSNIYEDKNFLTSDGFTQIMNPTERTAPLSLTHLYGNAEQKTLSGINLFDTSSNIWRASDRDKVVYNATADDFTFHRDSGGDYIIEGGSLALKPSTNYTIMFDVSQNTMTDSFRRITSNSNFATGTISIPAGQTGKFYSSNLATGSTLTAIYDLWFYCNSTGNFKAKIMLVEGSYTAQTFPEYQKFVGGTPSPNPDFPQGSADGQDYREEPSRCINACCRLYQR